MPPQANRLSRSEFNQVFKVGRRIHLPTTTLITTTAPTIKISVVVGKKVAKLAHERNRLKRQAYHHLFPLLKSRQVAVIVILKPSLKSLSQSALKQVWGEVGGRIINSQ